MRGYFPAKALILYLWAIFCVSEERTNRLISFIYGPKDQYSGKNRVLTQMN